MGHIPPNRQSSRFSAEPSNLREPPYRDQDHRGNRYRDSRNTSAESPGHIIPHTARLQPRSSTTHRQMGFRRYPKIHPRLPVVTTPPTNRLQGRCSHPSDSTGPDDEITQPVLDSTQQLRDHTYPSNGRDMHRQQTMAHHLRMALWHLDISEDLCPAFQQQVPQMFPIHRHQRHPRTRSIRIRTRRTMNLAEKKGVLPCSRQLRSH